MIALLHNPHGQDDMTKVDDLAGILARLRAKTLVRKSGCWDWTAAKDQNGYGRISIGGQMQLAHRYSYLAHSGQLPDGMCVLHRCDNPACINPSHLFLGTQADNMTDKASKGRAAFPVLKGAANGFSKLSVSDVLSIRAAEGISQRKLAKMFGVSQLHISRIRSRKAWAHI